MRWQPGILLYQLLYYYAVVISIREVDGFAVIKNNPSAFYTKVTSLHLKDKDDDDNDNEGDSWDSEEDYDQFESEDEEDEFPLSTPNLGIDIGSQLKKRLNYVPKQRQKLIRHSIHVWKILKN